MYLQTVDICKNKRWPLWHGIGKLILTITLLNLYEISAWTKGQSHSVTMCALRSHSYSKNSESKRGGEEFIASWGTSMSFAMCSWDLACLRFCCFKIKGNCIGHLKRCQQADETLLHLFQIHPLIINFLLINSRRSFDCLAFYYRTESLLPSFFMGFYGHSGLIFTNSMSTSRWNPSSSIPN